MKEKLKLLLGRPMAMVTAAVLLIGVIAGGYALADFTLSHRAKRVIAAIGDNEQYFSSNYLRMGEDPVWKTPPFTTAYVEITDEQYYYMLEWDTVDRPLTIGNFAQGYSSIHWFDRDIPYTIKAQLVTLKDTPPYYNIVLDTDPAAYTTLTGNGAAISDLTLDGTPHNATLEHDSSVSSLHSYTVSFPKAMLTNGVYYLIEATPNADLGLEKISALLNIERATGSTTSGWVLKLLDEKTDEKTGRNRNPSNYSGFNYQMTGSGAGEITLTWDYRLELDAYFPATLQSYTLDSDARRIVFPVDVYDTSFDTRFYLTNGPLSQWPDNENNPLVTMNYQKNAS